MSKTTSSSLLVALSSLAALTFSAEDARAEMLEVVTQPIAAPAPVAPSPATIVQYYPYAASPTCTLAEASIAVTDARTAADLVCGELASLRTSTFRLRFGSLGARLVLTVDRSSVHGHDQRALILSGLDEVPSAGRRIAAAFIENKPLVDTASNDTVLSADTVALKTRAGRVGLDLGVAMASTLGYAASPTGGAYLAVRYESRRIAFGVTGRWAGVGSGEKRYFGGSLDIGGRVHFSDTGVVPFVGAGIGFASFNVSIPGSVRQVSPTTTTSTGSGGLAGSGTTFYAEAGLHLLKLDRVSWNVALRVDVPTFSMKDEHSDERHYGAPIALTTGVTFQ